MTTDLTPEQLTALRRSDGPWGLDDEARVRVRERMLGAFDVAMDEQLEGHAVVSPDGPAVEVIVLRPVERDRLDGGTEPRIAEGIGTGGERSRRGRRVAVVAGAVAAVAAAFVLAIVGGRFDGDNDSAVDLAGPSVDPGLAVEVQAWCRTGLDDVREALGAVVPGDGESRGAVIDALAASLFDYGDMLIGSEIRSGSERVNEVGRLRGEIVRGGDGVTASQVDAFVRRVADELAQTSARSPECEISE